MHDEHGIALTDDDELAGAFLEMALSADEVARTIVEEQQLGIRSAECAFLGRSDAALPIEPNERLGIIEKNKS